MKYGSYRCHTDQVGFGHGISQRVFLLGPTCRHLCRSAAQDPSGFITYHGFPKEKCFVLCAFMSVKCTPQGSPRISRHPSAWVPARAHQNPQKIQGSKRVMDHHGSCMAICFLGAIGCPMVPIIIGILCHTCLFATQKNLPTCQLPNPQLVASKALFAGLFSSFARNGLGSDGSGTTGKAAVMARDQPQTSSPVSRSFYRRFSESKPLARLAEKNAVQKNSSMFKWPQPNDMRTLDIPSLTSLGPLQSSLHQSNYYVALMLFQERVEKRISWVLSQARSSGKHSRAAYLALDAGRCWEMLEHGQKTLMIQICFAIQSLVNYNQSYLPNIRSPWAGPQNWTSGSNIILNNGFVWGVCTIASDYIRWKKLQCLNADDPWLFQESWSHLGANELKLKSRSIYKHCGILKLKGTFTI